MSQSIAKQQTQQPAQTIAVRIALNGNLAALSEPQIWEYYQQMCGWLELDPLSRPFDILEGYEGTGENRQLRKVLYPNSSCSAQLANKRRVSFGPVKIEAEAGLAGLGMKIARITVECATPEGRKLVGEAFIDLVGKYGPLTGKNLENALKKGATQARRRGTLQLCGLTLPDEDEHQSISVLGEIEEEPVIEMRPAQLPGNAGVLGPGGAGVDAAEEAEPDPDREAYEQELEHRELEGYLKETYLSIGKTEDEWHQVYNDMDLANESLARKRILLDKWQKAAEQRKTAQILAFEAQAPRRAA